MSRRRAERYWVHSDPEPPSSEVPKEEADPCPGECNRAWRRAPVDLDTGRHLDARGNEIPATPGQPTWCRPCAQHITATLAGIPDHAAQLRDISVDGRLNTGRDHGDQTRKGTRTGSPTGSASLDLVDVVASWLADCRDELAGHLGQAPTGIHDVKLRLRSVATNTRWLVGHSTAWLCSPTAVEVGRSTLAWAVVLERSAGADRLRHRLPAPCPSCDRLTLVRDDGSERVDCAACKASWDETTYQHLVMVLADEARRAG